MKNKTITDLREKIEDLNIIIEDLQSDVSNEKLRGDIQFDRAEQLQGKLDELDEDMQERISELEEFKDNFEEFEAMCNSYNLSENQLYQDQILNYLKDNFGLKLIVVPAKNK